MAHVKIWRRLCKGPASMTASIPVAIELVNFSFFISRFSFVAAGRMKLGTQELSKGPFYS
jgi:hypothetical protein